MNTEILFIAIVKKMVLKRSTGKSEKGVTAEQLWKTADQSREFTLKSDKENWIGIFSKSATIEDPVGM